MCQVPRNGLSVFTVVSNGFDFQEKNDIIKINILKYFGLHTCSVHILIIIKWKSCIGFF